MSIEGIRVVRGPDWSLGDVDGGEGHVGTVTNVKADHTVEVQWDMGKTTTCRTGKGNKCDLRVLDSAPAGVRHDNFTCDACNQSNFAGTRWHCSQCSDFDLCSPCYFKDKHNIQHTFFRFDAPGMDGVRQPKRATSERRRSWGMFEDATVKRGPDWRYSNQDGGNGKVGTIMSNKKWSDSCRGDRNGVAVRWQNNNKYAYRLGYDGKVDILCVEATHGTDYYKEHLVPLNLAVEAQKHAGIPCCPSDTDRVQPKTILREKSFMTGVDCVGGHTFRKGDKVCIKLPEVSLKEAQKGHGGWTSSMIDYVGQHGEVKNVEGNGDVLVRFNGKEWRLFSGAVCKVPVVNVGDVVRIVDDEEKAEAMQKRHGGWVSEMKPTLGKAGKVVKIDSDGDVAVSFGKKAFVYNPACCVPAAGAKPEDIDCAAKDSDRDSDEDDKEDMSEQLANLVAQMFVQILQPTQAVEPLQFVKAAASNDPNAVLAMLKAKPDIVNRKVQGLTALIIASHEGHSDVVRVLIKGKADMNATETKGNTALMAAIMKKREDVARMLMDAGADVTVRNDKQMNALHHAALNDATSSLPLLIQRGCNINQQDCDGDTPIHCGIFGRNSSSVAYLLKAPNIDLSLCNKAGHNPVHLAALKDEEVSLSKLLAKAPVYLDKPKEDGYTPLHVAAVNNNVAVIKTLIKLKAKVDRSNNQQLTPLLLACHQGYLDASKLLVDSGASLSVSDEDGDTPLHMCLLGRRNSGGMDMLARLIGISVTTADEVKERTELACFLIQKGSDITATNKKGRDPLECCSNDNLKMAVERFSESYGGQRRGASGLLELLSLLPTPCLVSDCERMADAVFKPCGHKVCCRRCSVRVDECPGCNRHISERRTLDGDTIEPSPCKVQ